MGSLCSPSPPWLLPGQLTKLLPLLPLSMASHTELLLPPGMLCPTPPPHVAYAHAPLVYHALDTGLVYPVAEPYVHDATGDVADDASPAAEAYVHDVTGDVSDNSSPEAEAYVHDTTGDA